MVLSEKVSLCLAVNFYIYFTFVYSHHVTLLLYAPMLLNSKMQDAYIHFRFEFYNRFRRQCSLLIFVKAYHMFACSMFNINRQMDIESRKHKYKTRFICFGSLYPLDFTNNDKVSTSFFIIIYCTYTLLYKVIFPHAPRVLLRNWNEYNFYCVQHMQIHEWKSTPQNHFNLIHLLDQNLF